MGSSRLKQGFRNVKKNISKNWAQRKLPWSLPVDGEVSATHSVLYVYEYGNYCS